MLQITGLVLNESEFDQHDQGLLSQFAVCNDEFVSVGQMRQVFINWADKPPKDWQRPEQFGVWHALHEEWPCQ